jgi:hypothetical protein
MSGPSAICIGRGDVVLAVLARDGTRRLHLVRDVAVVPKSRYRLLSVSAGLAQTERYAPDYEASVIHARHNGYSVDLEQVNGLYELPAAVLHPDRPALLPSGCQSGATYPASFLRLNAALKIPHD